MLAEQEAGRVESTIDPRPLYDCGVLFVHDFVSHRVEWQFMNSILYVIASATLIHRISVGAVPTARKKTRSREGSVGAVASAYSMGPFTFRTFNLSGYGNSILFLL